MLKWVYFKVKQSAWIGSYNKHIYDLKKHTYIYIYIYIYIQGEHKFFPCLQTFITRKLREIQTYIYIYIYILNVTQLKKFFYNTHTQVMLKYMFVSHVFFSQ